MHLLWMCAETASRPPGRQLAANFARAARVDDAQQPVPCRRHPKRCRTTACCAAVLMGQNAGAWEEAGCRKREAVEDSTLC